MTPSSQQTSGFGPESVAGAPTVPTIDRGSALPGSSDAESVGTGRTGGPTNGRQWRRPLGGYASAAAVFLALSVGLWWHVWTGHPSAAATCGCGDPAVFMWFMEWPAYAISHGLNPFYSAAVFHPVGTDLLSTTSVLAIGIPLVPATFLFGPIAALNVAITAAPVVTGLATFWLLRRWVRWTPAAFAGALVYAFSPFVLSSLETAHLMTAVLAPVPLIVGCLEELLLRHRHRPVWAGVALAVLVAIEFLVSTEILAMLAISAAIGLVVLVVYGLATDRASLFSHVRRATWGLFVAAALTVCLLAYPAWFALAGPAHLSGPIWPNLTTLGSSRLGTLVNPRTSAGSSGPTLLGGYLGIPLPQGTYVGWGLLAVSAATLLVWRRDRRLWFLTSMAVTTGALMLGVRRSHWMPFQLVARLPLANDAIAQRFVALTLLALCGMLAIGIDRASRLQFPMGRLAHRTGRRRLPLSLPIVAVTAAFAAAVVPLLVPLARTVPYAIHPVKVPTWFTRAGRSTAPGTVVLIYPAPFSGIESPMAWQAVDAMSFTQAGGSGPQSVPSRDGRQRAAMAVLSSLSFGFTPAPVGTPSQLASVRRALRAWGVTTVVVAEDPPQPLFIGGRDPWYAAAFITAALATVPRFEDGAWIWSNVGTASDSAPVTIARGALATCATLAENHRNTGAVATCVLRLATIEHAGGP